MDCFLSDLTFIKLSQDQRISLDIKYFLRTEHWQAIQDMSSGISLVVDYFPVDISKAFKTFALQEAFPRTFQTGHLLRIHESQFSSRQLRSHFPGPYCHSLSMNHKLIAKILVAKCHASRLYEKAAGLWQQPKSHMLSTNLSRKGLVLLSLSPRKGQWLYLLIFLRHFSLADWHPLVTGRINDLSMPFPGELRNKENLSPYHQ